MNRHVSLELTDSLPSTSPGRRPDEKVMQGPREAGSRRSAGQRAHQ